MRGQVRADRPAALQLQELAHTLPVALGHGLLPKERYVFEF